MLAPLSPRRVVLRHHPRAPPARAHRPVADPPEQVATENVRVLAESERADGDVMTNHAREGRP